MLSNENIKLLNKTLESLESIPNVKDASYRTDVNVKHGPMVSIAYQFTTPGGGEHGNSLAFYINELSEESLNNFVSRVRYKVESFNKKAS